MKRQHHWIPLFLLLPLLSCGPVIAIGWQELLLLLVVFLVLFGLPIFRIIRQFDDFRKSQRKKKEK